MSLGQSQPSVPFGLRIPGPFPAAGLPGTLPGPLPPPPNAVANPTPSDLVLYQRAQHLYISEYQARLRYASLAGLPGAHPITGLPGASPYDPASIAMLQNSYFYKGLDPRNRYVQEEPKPSHSYIGLIGMAILSSKEKKLILADIYQWILDNYAYFRHRGPGWRNSIRHNLSLNDCFIKSGRSANGKGHFWAVHPANVEDFKRGDFRRRRAQRKVRKHMGLAVDDEDSPSPPPTNAALEWPGRFSPDSSVEKPEVDDTAALSPRGLPKKRGFDVDSLLRSEPKLGPSANTTSEMDSDNESDVIDVGNTSENHVDNLPAPRNDAPSSPPLDDAHNSSAGSDPRSPPLDRRPMYPELNLAVPNPVAGLPYPFHHPQLLQRTLSAFQPPSSTITAWSGSLRPTAYPFGPLPGIPFPGEFTRKSPVKSPQEEGGSDPEDAKDSPPISPTGSAGN